MSNDITSILSQERKDEIVSNYSSLIEELKLHRKEHKDVASKREIDLRKPAWVRVNPAPPIGQNNKSYRLCIGFQNVGCKYREKDELRLGCLNCGYYARTAFEDVDSKIVFEQFKAGLKQGCKDTTGFNSVEFLNDGSFLNAEEFDQPTMAKLFDLVARMPHVRRVLVESRPEHVSANGINFLLSHLNRNQILEVGVGLESIDDFVRETCINKGFSIVDFEKALDVFSSFDAQYCHKITFVVYLIVKPAFLTHTECIEDIILSLKYISSISDRYQFKIVPKLEPAAIADGTVLSMLHKKHDSKFYYEPLNYWAVLEILARVACDIGEKEFEIRIGAREDMDDVVKAPAVYKDDGETFHPFDFVLYESIQKFNQHQNYARLFAVVGEVYRLFNDIPLTDSKSSLMIWLRANGIENSSIEKFMEVNDSAIRKNAKKKETKHDIEEMVTIYRVLDILEGYSSDAHGMKKRIDEAILNRDETGLEQCIDDCFEKVAPRSIVQVSIVAMSTAGDYAEVFFDVTNLLRAEKVSVWSRFSLECRNMERTR